MLTKVLVAAVLAVVFSLLLTPWVRRLAFKVKAIDRPDERKVHKSPMPRMGGLAVFLSFALTVILLRPFSLPLAGLLVGGLLIVLLGILDDIKGLPAKVKLGGQILAALAVVPFGIQVDFITNPLTGGIITLGIFAVPLTVFWIISVTNAVNLIDGLDGLAGGTSMIAALTVAAVAWKQGVIYGGSGVHFEVAVLAVILAGAILGFLRYNFYPAKIFLGDTGSMFLGYCLSVLAVMGLTKSAAAISVFIPIVILGIPLLDTFFAIVRRCCKHQPIFKPDKEHLHHRLMALGFSHRQAVLVIYCISAFMGGSAYLLNVVTTDQAVFVLAALSLIVIVGANKIGVTGTKKVPGANAQRNLEL
ncbi:UDP-GlcNAc:undecaprenyl-phosphate GlcNAc-1-phosphate transferase [Desulfohalotomaculum tongense]|uniref:glycosyltransferase family 4 protein n=1 Tax=Desulforadius tongensis TaxID=1216062 RepID=UPI00195781B0|nr:MraY family glycosyltransferase [Desulforadius tongensis]MBM7853691.1 UDP-GlcNAc:undecaprenyl-phosphate GlcNAc-1-phosphate transferase [Desulforadius tongensis]